MSVNETKLNEFLGKVVGDMGAAVSSALVLTGDQLGLYKAMNDSKPITPTELAKKTGTNPRYIQEWLNNQAASGYVTYDASTKKYTLPPEQATCLADETSPAFVAGAFQAIYAVFQAQSKMKENFKTGKGMDWGEQHPSLFEGTERFFRPNYIGNLVSSWIPSLDGVEAKLKKGAKVADIGCGHGASTILMAKTYPNSKFFAFDAHKPSIEIAQKRAKEAGVADRITFSTAKSTDFPGENYDLITYFDCLHDMGDPVGASRHTHQALAKDGTWMIVEPFAGDKPEENHNPIGRVYYGVSSMVCVPASLAHNGPALGAQAGEERLKSIVMEGGFKKFRRATETPFNIVLEARP
jgi:2-polyprenyl-3-methyl-5-hydroxy-6-metoxy-1,4-benzoquinol methylase